MRKKVIKAFKDRYTKLHYEVDDVFETEDVGRVNFLTENGYLGGEALASPPPVDDGEKSELEQTDTESEQPAAVEQSESVSADAPEEQDERVNTRANTGRRKAGTADKPE